MTCGYNIRLSAASATSVRVTLTPAVFTYVLRPGQSIRPLLQEKKK